MKKGQTATEYLIILAVVIIIALIVVGVMGGIPGMGGGARSKTSQAYWSTATLAIPSSVIRTNDATFNIQNNAGKDITVTEITIDDGVNAPVPLNVVDKTITLGNTESIPSVGATFTCTAGDTFSYSIAIAYTDVNGGTYTFTGEQNYEGTCSG